MATLKLKKTPARADKDPRQSRAPVRGQGSAPRKRPTLSEAQAARAEREARYQEQLRQRFGDKPPAQFVRREEPEAFERPRPAPRRNPAEGYEPGRGGSNTAFSGGRASPQRDDQGFRRDDVRGAGSRSEPAPRRDHPRSAPRRDDPHGAPRRTQPAARRDE